MHEADPTKRKVPSAAVCPSSVEELRGALRIANAHGIPVWTFSRGKNLGYGGPAPRVNGSVALDLHRMNKVIEVNDQYHYAVVEPGVTFMELYRYCVERGKRVWPSTASLGWGSVMGNVSTFHFLGCCCCNGPGVRLMSGCENWLIRRRHLIEAWALA